TFSESLNPNTINGNNFALFAGNTRLSVSVNRSSDNRTVTLSTTLPAASTITVVATSDVKDLSGNSLVDFRSQFSTVAAIDTNRPQVVSQRPGNGANAVATGDRVVLFISKPMNVSTMSGALHISQNGVLVNGTTQVSGNGQVIQFTPSSPWLNNALIQV